MIYSYIYICVCVIFPTRLLPSSNKGKKKGGALMTEAEEQEEGVRDLFLHTYMYVRFNCA